MLLIPSACPAFWATLGRLAFDLSHWKFLFNKLLTVCISPKEEAVWGLLRFKFTIKMIFLFFFFLTLAANFSCWQIWHICPSHKMYKWVIHEDEILHCCHSKNVCFEKKCAIFCKYLAYQYKFTNLLLEFEHFSFFFWQCRHTHKVTSCISVHIWHACLQTQLNWPFLSALMTHQQLVSERAGWTRSYFKPDNFSKNLSSILPNAQTYISLNPCVFEEKI